MDDTQDYLSRVKEQMNDVKEQIRQIEELLENGILPSETTEDHKS